MANLKEIKGFSIQNLTEDPSPFAQAVADNPYSGAWSSGGAMNTYRARGAGDGTQTAFITFSGTTPSPGSQLTNTETYDGTSFTEVNDMNTGRTGLAGVGTTTASLAATGSAGTGIGTFVESWNGSSWTETTENNTARQQLAAFGTQTAMIIASGLEPPFSSAVEYWNGTSWTEVNEVNTARQGLNEGGAGVYTAGMIAGGRKAHPSNPGQEGTETETWNGSSWTEVNELNEAKQLGGLFGTQTSALYAGGADTGTLASSESWDGSSWSETSDLATGRYQVQSGGANNQSGIIAGGTTGATEEWSFSGVQSSDPAVGYANAIVGQVYYNSTTGQFKSIKSGGAPIGTWASGGDMNTQGYQLFSFGTQTSAVRAGGYGGPPVGFQANAEHYNGTSWTALSGINDSRSNEAGAGSGTYTAGLIYAGNTPPFANTVESWNGSSWTEVAEVNTARVSVAGVGTSTATLIFLGQDAPGGSGYTTKVESWNGSSWTETTDANTARGGVVGIGQVYTAALAATGYSPSPPAPALVEDWNGTAWTEVAEVNSGRPNAASRSGTSTDGIIASGGARSVNCEHWNGSSWTEIANVATGRYGIGGQGTTSGAAVAFGGNTAASDPAGVVTTEEFTAADFEIKTITTS